MLAGRIVQIPQIDLPYPGGLTKALDIACHTATCYWLYEEAHGTPPGADEFMGDLLDLSKLITDIAKLGTRLKKSDIKSIQNGTVLIFCDLSGSAKHSCVVRYDGKIGGYNQENWFTTPGSSHAYTHHEVNDIMWKGLTNKRVKLNTENSVGRLIAVTETKAVDFIRSKTPKR